MSSGDYHHGDLYSRSQQPQHAGYPAYLHARNPPSSTEVHYQSNSQSQPAITSGQPYQSLQDLFQYSSTADTANYTPVNCSTYDANAVDSLTQTAQYNRTHPTAVQQPHYSPKQQHQIQPQVYRGSQNQVLPAQATVSHVTYSQRSPRDTNTRSAQGSNPMVRPQPQTQSRSQNTGTYGQQVGPPPSQREASQWQSQTQPARSSSGSYSQYSNVRSEGKQQSQPPISHFTESTTTVDPSQVYDASHEYRRLAHLAKANAARKAKMEEGKKTEEAKREADRAKREEEECEAKETEIARATAEARQMAAQAATNQEIAPRSNKVQKALDGAEDAAEPQRKEKMADVPSDNGRSIQTQMDQMQAAAMTLMQTANGEPNKTKEGLEDQMRAMFIKMREFNSLDPDMLSRLWQQERDDHLAREVSRSQASPTQSTSAPVRPSQAVQSNPRKETPRQSSKQVPPTEQPELVTFDSVSATLNFTSAPVEISSSTRPAKKTIWPGDKKASLAQTASTLLMSMAGNNGLTLSPSEISVLLDASPTYIQLCDQIEAKGVKVDRSQFAKKLLSSVPDVKASGTTSAPKDPSDDSVASTTAQGIFSRRLANAEKRIMNGASLLMTSGKPGRPNKDQEERSTQMQTAIPMEIPPPPRVTTNHQLEGLHAVKMFVDGQASEQQQPEQRQQTPTSAKPTKERKGNKTQASRQSFPPVPATKQDLARKRTFSDLVDLTLLDSSDDEDIFFTSNKRQALDESAGRSMPTPPYTTSAGHSPASKQSPGVSDPANGNIALGRQQQHQQPIAVPIASATSQSTMTQSGQSTQSGDSQPLSTSHSLVPSIPALPVDHPGRRIQMIKTLEKYNAIRRSSYDPKTIARDVLIACGRHPEMRSLNAHLEALKSLGVTVDNGSDLSTFRWDVVDPGGPPPGSGAPPLPVRPFLIDVDSGDVDSDDDSVLGVGDGVHQAVGVGADGQSTLRMARPAVSMSKKKSRVRLSEPIERSHAESGAAGRGRPRHSEGGSSSQARRPQAPNSYALLRQQQAVATGSEPVKKKGRPFGWRKYMMADPSSYRGASAKNASPKKREPEPEPVYQVFKCEWKDCGAELHNLATLTKHIHKIHGQPGGDGNLFQCHWKDCGKVLSIKDHATGRVQPRLTPFEFNGIEGWKYHVEQRHISPISWKQGDGPKGGVSDNYESEVSESYMRDTQGRRVTPRVVASEASASPARKRTQAEKDAEQTRAEAEARKRQIGPGVDRGGATLVTEKRKQGFVDDDDVIEIVDDSDN